MFFTITGVKKIVPYTEDLVIQRFTVVNLWSQVVKVILISSKVIQSL